jgi:hypothetical protein
MKFLYKPMKIGFRTKSKWTYEAYYICDDDFERKDFKVDNWQ